MPSESRQLSIVGVGELIFDHICSPGQRDNEGSLRESRGGGSVFNILANLAQLGWNAAVQGVVGQDAAGDLALADLQGLGVDTTGVKQLPGRRTRLIFEVLGVRNSAQVGGTRHSFTTKCPVCSRRIETNQRPALRANTLKEPVPTHWALYDQLTAGRIEHAKEARKAGAGTVLDLGAVGYLRYQPTARILSHLRLFDLIFLNSKVAASITKRAGIPEADLSSLLPGSVLVVTRGEHGATVTDSFGFTDRVRAPEVPRVLDDAGAGDALCAHTLNHLARSTGLRNFRASEVAEALKKAEQEIIEVLGVIGARGHLPQAPTCAEFNKLIGRSFDDVREESKRANICLLCKLPHSDPNVPRSLAHDADHEPPAVDTPVRPRRLGARSNASLLLNRMLRVAENEQATQGANEVLRGERRRTYVVGSGGSLPAASYISSVLKAYGHFACALTPGEYLSTPTRSDSVIVVSYSGSTHDHGRVIEAARHNDAPRIVLLTGSSSPTLVRELRTMEEDVYINYSPSVRASRRGEGVRERGFVSITGTVAPCVPWLTAALGIHVVVDMVDRLDSSQSGPRESALALAAAAVTTGRLHVVYGPGGHPAALDIESKFAESGLPAVTLHEQKDLSHGRFITVFQHPSYRSPGHDEVDVLAPVLMLGTGPMSKYQSAVCRALESAQVPTAKIWSDAADLTAPLELLTAVQWFSQEFGNRLGLDISRPKSIPEEGLRLYKWRGPLP